VFKKLSLTTSMLLLTFAVGLVIWLISDAYQVYALNAVFRENLTQRFSEQAREQRLRFDSYIKSYNPSIKLYATNTRLLEYLQAVDWSAPPHEIIRHQEVPSWLPKLSSMRRFVHPRYAFLIDDAGRVREIYIHQGTSPPSQLLNISPLTLELSTGQGYLTLFDGKPYLLAAEKVKTIDKNAVILIASPIDEKFLQDSQGVFIDDSVIALLKEGEKNILVSSNENLVPHGSSLHDLQQSYLLVGEGFFDSGSADIIVRFYSLTSTMEVQKQSDELLMQDRKIRAITAFAFIFSFAIVMYWITSRIRSLSHRVVEFSDHMNISQPDLKHNDELMVLENRFELLAAAVQTETQALEHQALHDPLTNIPNRKFLNNCLQQEVARCKISGCTFVLLLCDLNRFKEVNDTLGHHIGDLVLQQSCIRLQSSLRKDDIVARLGGDEFCILLKKINIGEAEKIVVKITEAFNRPFSIERNIINIGISIGIVEYPKHGHTEELLMQHADAAMYFSKQNRTGHAVYRHASK
jgi:diguanylate cyclase (GGDEF)-like protein